MNVQSTEAVETLWKGQTAVIRAFLEARPKYEKLSEEVAYILENALNAAKLEYAHISHRVKSLDSFCEKIIRKSYKNPLQEITDLGGVRVVYLYLSDRRKIEKLIERQFHVVEKTDKVEESEVDRFGYGALHYLIRLGKKSSGARYDELKELTCELQVRTILQDAWAVVNHHLSYKHESDIPKTLRRSLNALAGLFETADERFDSLRGEREVYMRRIKDQISKQGPDSVTQEMNLESLLEYLKWRFPDREQPSRDEGVEFLSEVIRSEIRNLAQVDMSVVDAFEAVEAYEESDPPANELGFDSRYTALGFVRTALHFTNKKYAKRWAGLGDNLQKFRYLVKGPGSS